MPLALILPRGDQWYLLRKPLIRRDKGDTLSLLVQFLLKLRVPCAPPPASLLISTIFELAATGPTLPFLHLFLVPPKSRVCVCVCVFKLHITAQPGPVVLVILCHSHWSSQGGINDTYYENLWSDATKGTHSLYLHNSCLSSGYLVLPPLLPCDFLDYLGRQLLNQLFLVFVFLSFRPSLPRFPHRVYIFLLFLALLCLSFAVPDPILVPVILVPVPISATALVSVPVPSPVPSCVRPRVSILVPVPVAAPSPLPSPFHLAFLRSPPPTFLSPLRPRPVPDPVPAPDSDLALGPVCSFPSLGPGCFLGTMRVYRHRALRTELSGARKPRTLSANMMTLAEWKRLLYN